MQERQEEEARHQREKNNSNHFHFSRGEVMTQQPRMRRAAFVQSLTFTQYCGETQCPAQWSHGQRLNGNTHTEVLQCLPNVCDNNMPVS